MAKELNRHLFDPEKAPARNIKLREEGSPPAGNSWQLPPVPSSESIQKHKEKQMQKEINQLKQKLKEVERRADMMEAQLSEVMRSSTMKWERYQQKIFKLESTLADKIQELSDKHLGVVSKLNDRRLTESKIQELVDRHNNLVRNFESKLAQLTRALSEREMQMMSLANMNEEARREIARLKKL